MTSQDQARADLVAYHKAVIAGRTAQALAIEQRYDLAGYPPRVVSIGLAAAAEGRDHHAAIDEHLEPSDPEDA